MSPCVRKRCPARSSSRAQLGVVVELAVLDDVDGAVLVRDRLVAGLEVDDREPARSEADGPFDEGAVAVGAAVEELRAHPRELVRVGGPASPRRFRRSRTWAPSLVAAPAQSCAASGRRSGRRSRSACAGRAAPSGRRSTRGRARASRPSRSRSRGAPARTRSGPGGRPAAASTPAARPRAARRSAGGSAAGRRGSCRRAGRSRAAAARRAGPPAGGGRRASSPRACAGRAPRRGTGRAAPRRRGAACGT